MSKSKRNLINILEIITTLFLVVVGIFMLVSSVFSIVYSPKYVVGFSMKPTLNNTVETDKIDGDIVYVNRFKSVAVNDIVVVNVQGWLRDSVIKRLVATPGDVLEIVDNTDQYLLKVNEQILYTKPKNYFTDDYFNLYQKFINNNVANKDFSSNITADKKIKLNANQYFLMGDNWGNTTDSMTNGFVNLSEIEGKVDFVIPYKQNKFAELFKQMVKVLFTVKN